MKKTLILLFVFLVFAFVITPKAKLLQITGRGSFNTLGEGDMPPFKQAYSFSALLSLTGLPVGVEVERLSASRTTEIGEVRASTFGALGEILLRIGGKPINFLLLAGYGLYNEKFSFTVGTETASIKEQSGGAKAGIYLQFFLGENLLLTGGGSYRKLPLFTEGKELNFSGFEFSAGIGLQL